jgi:hypothetical protein
VIVDETGQRPPEQLMIDLYGMWNTLLEELRSRHEALSRISPDAPDYEEAVQQVLDATTELLDVEDQIPAWEQRRIERYVTVMLVLFTLAIAMLTVFAAPAWRWLLIPILLACLVLIVARILGWVAASDVHYNVGVWALAATFVLAVISVFGLLPASWGVLATVIGAAIGLALLGFHDGVRQLREASNVFG